MNSATYGNLAPTALIVGCGFVGRRLLSRLVELRRRVLATTQDPRNVSALAELGAEPLVLSVTQLPTLASLRAAVEAGDLDVYYLVPPGRGDEGRVAVEGLASVLRGLKGASIRRGVMASSTGVYGQRDGCRVDAQTPPEPADDRARMLLDSERVWLDAGPAMRVVRLAGLYGPGRIIGLSGLRDGAPILGSPDGLLNLIHRDDAAELLLAVADAPGAARIELGCDGSPTRRIDYYREAARLLSLAEPRVMPLDAAAAMGVNVDRLRRASSKACDNTPTRRRTGWRPRYPSFSLGLADSL